ncbi:MAG: leucine-rich repeat domain-containing protein [Muribaculum sp.]|nr:leucine-rich repeat domain-containing protein [Muribaculum sp.]
MTETEREYPIPGGSLYYRRMDGKLQPDAAGGICITRMQGLAGEVEIPERIGDCPVRAIDRKAFLSRKHLRKVTVPAGVREVGDWAFAYCDSLHTVVFRAAEEAAGEPIFGRALFLECASLRFLYLRGQQADLSGADETTAALLAAAVTTADAPYLLDAAEAGSGEWLAKWDARMLAVLHSTDQEGYSKQVLCGEEDYGSTDAAAYESGRRRIKVRLILLRLLYSRGLSGEDREEMERYLRAHTKGCAHAESWKVVLEEHGGDSAYFRLFAECGCVNAENLEALLADVGGDCPELKAFLIRYQEEHLTRGDFFEALEL